ncbi:hypothetical protein BDV98DRAFT_598697 [Pterulicium gracile]|uniref:Uncharacterized protein n=1 Tax=Pterulicium gracile TaxID=1884261 RepID=A0A5C3QA60_9AGAR|nr:hypothetical protein BDV98DRAFT_598697 [Pterula gracilis]
MAPDKCRLCQFPDLMSYTPDLQSRLFNQSLDFSPSELASADDLRKDLADRISTIETAIDQLNIVKHQIQIQLNRQTNLVAPIHRLPDDIFIPIFQSVVDETPTGMPDDDRAIIREFRTAAPWSCASVCKRWRIVCLSRPQLWSRIIQWDLPWILPKRAIRRDVPRTLPNIARFQNHRIEKQLTRCGTSSLTGVLGGFGTITRRDLWECDESALSILCDAIPRFRQLELWGGQFLGTLLDRTVGFDSLETLLVQSQWLDRNRDVSFRNAPITSLTFHGMPRIEDSDDAQLYHNLVSWTPITTLDYSCVGFGEIPLHDLMRTLSLTPHLSYLTLSPDSTSTIDNRNLGMNGNSMAPSPFPTSDTFE